MAHFFLYRGTEYLLQCLNKFSTPSIPVCRFTDLQHRRTLTKTLRAWVHPGKLWARAPRPHRSACRCDEHILPVRRTSPPQCCWWELSVSLKGQRRKEWGHVDTDMTRRDVSATVCSVWTTQALGPQIQPVSHLPWTCHRPDLPDPRRAVGNDTLHTPLVLYLWLWEKKCKDI